MSISSNIRLTEISRQIKQPAVAGSFYPSDRDELQSMVEKMLDNVTNQSPPPKAIIAPHAGYIYSGPIAANAYASLYPVSDSIKKVVLLGPAHRVYLKGMAVSAASHFATPLGDIRINTALRDCVSKLSGVELMDEAFSQEHSLEVHLPFLQTALKEFTLLPVVVGDTNPDHVAKLIESVWGGEETLIVISTDLSHFHDYQTANHVDTETANFIKQLQYEKIGPKQACGCRPIGGLLKIARDKGHEISILDVRNSGDTAGSHDRVVGYGAFLLYENNQLSNEQKKSLLDIANNSIHHGLKNGTSLSITTEDYSGIMSENRGVFVTLEIDQQLRGCIGNLEAAHPLVSGVAINAFNAAFNDPRFKKLTDEEFKHCEISISVLTPRQEIVFENDDTLLEQITTGKDGLIISHGTRSATFLPAVWEKIQSPKLFLSQLKSKAGINVNLTPDKAWKYQSISFSYKKLS
jgi:MEMO1 family protein